MIDLAKINTLTADEVLVVNGLQKVAEEAKKASELIHKTYRCFGIGEEKIEVWSDEYNAEYLTYDGVWQARYLHQTYDVKCTPDGIFEYFKSEYLVSEGYADDYENEEKAHICKYFRTFLKKTEAKSNI